MIDDKMTDNTEGGQKDKFDVPDDTVHPGDKRKNKKAGNREDEATGYGTSKNMDREKSGNEGIEEFLDDKAEFEPGENQ